MMGTREIVGFGSMVLDRMHRTQRILGADQKGFLEPVAEGRPVELAVGGVLLNQFGWAALFGAQCGLFGRQAADDSGRVLREAMAGAGIEAHLDLTGSASSIAEIFIDEAGERAIYMAAGATSETTADHVRRDHANFIAGGRRLSTEVSQLPLDAVLEALRIAHEHGIATVVDLDILPSEAVGRLGDRRTFDAILGETDFLKPTERAARELFPGSEASDGLLESLRAGYDIGTVVMTQGDGGSWLCDERGARHVAAYSVPSVSDSTGAGDAFLGGLLAGQALGLDLDNAARLGSACGAACVEQVGGFPRDARALRERALELYDGSPLSDARWEGRENRQADEAPAAGAVAKVFEVAAQQLGRVASRADEASFRDAAELIEQVEARGGRTHLTGVGKPEHVAHYGASLFSSTGTPATFLHATELLHGSLGQLVPGDVVLVISNSGSTPEAVAAAQAVQRFGAKLIAVTGDAASELAGIADVVLDAGVDEEGGPLGLAPRASIAVEVLVLAALGAQLQSRRGFSSDDYARRHPAGALGRRARSGGD